MGEAKKTIQTILRIIVAIISVLLVVLNRSPIGIKHLGLQLLGVVGLLITLYVYNRPYRE